VNRRIISTIAAAACAGTVLVGTAPPADALGGKNSTTCAGDALKAKVHTEAARRENTLAGLETKLAARHDGFGLNQPQITTLKSAATQIAALYQEIQSTCYSTRAAFHDAASKIFTNYRVYWLRVPQTRAIEAADHLAEARAKLGDVARKLASHVGDDQQAQTDLATMNAALATADSKIGTAPTPSAVLAAAAAAQPAADMTADEAALNAAHDALGAARTALTQARDAARKVITDLKS